MLLQPAKNSIDIGIVVDDIQASLKFYKQILGLEKAGELQTSFGIIHRLRFGNSEVKLLVPTIKPSAGAIGLDQQIGFRYLTFTITNIADICQHLEAEGVEFTLLQTEIAPGVSIAMVKDPDGNIVEFVQQV